MRRLGDAHRTRRERAKREVITAIFFGECQREMWRFTIFNMQRLDRSGALVVSLQADGGKIRKIHTLACK